MDKNENNHHLAQDRPATPPTPVTPQESRPSPSASPTPEGDPPPEEDQPQPRAAGSLPSLVSPRSSPRSPCSPVPLNPEEEGHLHEDDGDPCTSPSHEQKQHEEQRKEEEQEGEEEEAPQEEGVERSHSSIAPRLRLSRIPVLEPSSLLLSSPTATTPGGTAKQKLLLKKAYQGAPLLLSPSCSLSPSFDRRCATQQPDPLTAAAAAAAADRSQDEESLQGLSVSDRQGGDEALSLSSSSSPLSRKSRIPRPVRPEGSSTNPENRSSQFMPRPPPGRPPSRPSIESR